MSNEMKDWLRDNAVDNMLITIRELKQLALRTHRYCEDSWYSCPMAENGCANEADGDECTCGADEHNLRVELLTKDYQLN